MVTLTHSVLLKGILFVVNNTSIFNFRRFPKFSETQIFVNSKKY